MGHPEEEFFELRQADQRGTLGLLKSVGVDPSFRRKGIASEMVKYGMASLKEKNVEVVMALAWKTETVHIGGVLSRMGFTVRKRYEGFWSRDSIEKNYTCPACGLPPCKCDTVLYSFTFAADKPEKSIGGNEV